MYSQIHWPDGLDEASFLRDYWQKKPLLIRQALPDFDTPLPADELAGLSLEPDTTPRLVLRDSSGSYHVEHGPFEAERFATLTGNDWSLLVTDVEKHVPELVSYLRPFAFLPNWRIDDLMISYAPVGASVGAHTDEYDVFLLQGSGVREWSIDASPAHDLAVDEASDLSILRHMRATDTWQLQPGDLLYLPPGIPHHGVAVEEPCTTWSIGFRAPAIPDFVMRVAEMICERLPSVRFSDGPLLPAEPGELTADAIARFSSLWRDAVTVDDADLALLTGRFLTESAPSSRREVDDPVSESSSLRLAPFCRTAWHASSAGDVHLFIDGESYPCTRRMAIELCTINNSLSMNDPKRSDEELALLKSLLKEGILVPSDH